MQKKQNISTKKMETKATLLYVSWLDDADKVKGRDRIADYKWTPNWNKRYRYKLVYHLIPPSPAFPKGSIPKLINLPPGWQPIF